VAGAVCGLAYRPITPGYHLTDASSITESLTTADVSYRLGTPIGSTSRHRDRARRHRGRALCVGLLLQPDIAVLGVIEELVLP
jgi:hypothetical protein